MNFQCEMGVAVIQAVVHFMRRIWAALCHSCLKPHLVDFPEKVRRQRRLAVAGRCSDATSVHVQTTRNYMAYMHTYCGCRNVHEDELCMQDKKSASPIVHIHTSLTSTKPDLGFVHVDACRHVPRLSM